MDLENLRKAVRQEGKKQSESAALIESYNDSCVRWTNIFDIVAENRYVRGSRPIILDKINNKVFGPCKIQAFLEMHSDHELYTSFVAVSNDESNEIFIETEPLMPSQQARELHAAIDSGSAEVFNEEDTAIITESLDTANKTLAMLEDAIADPKLNPELAVRWQESRSVNSSAQL